MCECLKAPYEPYPYFKREYNSEEYKYVQKVNWVEMQCADCLLYTSPSPRDRQKSRMPSSA